MYYYYFRETLMFAPVPRIKIKGTSRIISPSHRTTVIRFSEHLLPSLLLIHREASAYIKATRKLPSLWTKEVIIDASCNQKGVTGVFPSDHDHISAMSPLYYRFVYLLLRITRDLFGLWASYSEQLWCCSKSSCFLEFLFPVKTWNFTEKTGFPGKDH